MDFCWKKNMQQEILKTVLTEALKGIVAEVLKELVTNQVIYLNQEFYPLDQVLNKYGLSLTSAKKYDKLGLINLTRIDKYTRGKLYVSIIEIEKLFRANMIQKNSREF